MVKIIFLDLDGVLNIIDQEFQYFTSFNKFENIEYFERHLVARLNHIINQTDVNLVISSSWRLDMEQLEFELKKVNFKYWDKVIGSTPVRDNRGAEILEWLEKNYPNNDYEFLVIDDEIRDLKNIYPSNILEIDPRVGITREQVYQIIHYFGKEII